MRRITEEQHPHHAFVKVAKPSDIMTPKEQFTDVHPAVCNSCNTHIIGVRFKCLHPACPNFDLCQHCEALPIPVHPPNHPLVKFKHDYVGETENGNGSADYTKVFEFVKAGGLRVAPEPFTTASTPTPTPAEDPFADVEDVSQGLNERYAVYQYNDDVKTEGKVEGEKPHHVEVTIPRPELDFVTEEAQQPAELTMMSRSTVPVTMPGALFHFQDIETPVEPRVALPEVEEVKEAEQPLDASIEELTTQPIVPTPSAPSSPSPVVVPAPTPASPAPASRVASPSPSYSAVFVADNSVDDGHVFPAGAEFVKSWRMRNVGTTAWPETTVVAFIGGERCGKIETATPLTYYVGRVEAGALADVHAVDMKAPASSGRYVSYWRLQDASTGVAFGDQLWCE